MKLSDMEIEKIIEGLNLDGKDKVSDVAKIMVEIRKRNLLTGYPQEDRIERVYYLYEKIVCHRKELKHVDTDMTAYNYLHETTDDYHGVAITENHPIGFDTFKRHIEEDAYVNNELGINEDDRVTFLLPSMESTYSNFYALSKINSGRNIVDLRTSLEGIKKYINDSGSKYLFCLETMNPKALKELLNTTSIEKIRLFSPPFYSINNGLKRSIGRAYVFAEEFGYRKLGDTVILPKDVDDIKKSKNYDVAETEFDVNKPTLFMHTSGTSGFPKTVMINDKNVNVLADQYRKSLNDIKPGYRSLGIMPPWIIYGIFGFHMPLSLKENVYPVPDPESTPFDSLVMDIKPNTVAGVPNHWISLLSSKKIKDDTDLSFFKTAASGGDGISKENNDRLNKFFKEHGSKINLGPGYALSENTSVASVNQDPYDKSGSVGFLLPDIKCAIVSPTTHEPLKYNEKGVICVNGDLMLGYLNNEEESKKAFININGEKYAYTGDIGYMDENGYLYVTGREKNLIVRHDGFKVSPLEIENVVMKNDKVKNCVVFGIRDENYVQGCLPAVRVEFKNKNMSNEEKKAVISEIKDNCKKELSSYYIPVLYYCDNIPYTPMQKVDRKKISEDYEKAKTLTKKNSKIYR